MHPTLKCGQYTTVANSEIGGSVLWPNSANLYRIDIKWQFDWILNKRKMRSRISPRCDSKGEGLVMGETPTWSSICKAHLSNGILRTCFCIESIVWLADDAGGPQKRQGEEISSIKISKHVYQQDWVLYTNASDFFSFRYIFFFILILHFHWWFHIFPSVGGRWSYRSSRTGQLMNRFSEDFRIR